MTDTDGFQPKIRRCNFCTIILRSVTSDPVFGDLEFGELILEINYQNKEENKQNRRSSPNQ